MNREIPEIPAERAFIMKFQRISTRSQLTPFVKSTLSPPQEKKKYAHSYTSDFPAGGPLLLLVLRGTYWRSSHPVTPRLTRLLLIPSA